MRIAPFTLIVFCAAIVKCCFGFVGTARSLSYQSNSLESFERHPFPQKYNHKMAKGRSFKYYVFPPEDSVIYNVSLDKDVDKITIMGRIQKAIAVLCLATILSLPLLFASVAFAIESGGRVGKAYFIDCIYHCFSKYHVYWETGGMYPSSKSSSTTSPSSSMGDFSRGFGAGYFTPRPFWGDSFYGPLYRPFGWGWGWGGGFGISPYFGGGVTIYSPLSTWFGFLSVGIILIVFFSALFSASARNPTSMFVTEQSTYSSLVSLSLALNVSNRKSSGSILSTLKRLSYSAQSNIRVGMETLVHQVALELLRKKHTIVAASSHSSSFKTAKTAERQFNALAVRERSKFEKELVSIEHGVNLNIEPARQARPELQSTATMAVVTIILLLEGDAKIPPIKTTTNVEEALSIIASEAKVSGKLLAAEILWTPEDPSETLNEKDIISNYPNLINV